MSVTNVTKKVLLQKQIENTLYSILPQTDATVVQYTKGSDQDAQVTTVAAELAALATAAASVITEQQVDTKISTAATNLYNQISGLADGESLAASFDTLKEISSYLDTHGSVVAGFSSDISALQTALGHASVAADPENEIEAQAATGLFARIESLETAVAALQAVGATKVESSLTNGKIKINGVDTTVYDGDPTLIAQDSTHRFVSDTQTATWDAKAGVSVVSAMPAEPDANTLYFVELA